MLIAMLMEAVKAYETPFNLYETKRRNIPEGNHLQQNISLHQSHELQIPAERHISNAL
jgi:hypothetical protein